MEAKYKKFLEYNWRDSSEWQLYLSNLSEIPPGNKIEHFKKRFYKLKIDEEFDVKWNPEINNNQGSQQSFNYQNRTTNVSAIQNPFLAGIEIFIWVSFLFSTIFQYHTLKLACLALFIRVFRRTGLPKFTIEYAQVLFLDEHFQLLLYGLLLMIDRLNLFTLIPLGITAILNISEYAKNKPNLFRIILPYSNLIYNKRVELALIRANTEIAIGFLLICGIFFGLNSFIIPVFFWQYLRFKYIVNNDIKISFSKLNWTLDNFKNRTYVPSPIKYLISKIQDFAGYLGRTEPTNGQAAGGSNCLIF